MKYYSAIIRIGGRVDQEVWRHNLSAAEVILLNAIHGGTAVTNLTQTSEKQMDASGHRRLRRELQGKYAAKEKLLAVFHAQFGSAITGLLPETVTMDDLLPDVPLDDEEDAPEAAAPAPEVAEKPKAKDPAESKSEDDPVAAIRDSLKKLGAPLPKANASLEEHRAALKVAQQASTVLDD